MITENLVHVGGRMKFYPSEIIFLESDSNYTRLHFSDGSMILTSTNLGKLEPRFSKFNFFRPNKSFIINLDYIMNFEIESSQIKMENNELIKLSRRNTKKFISLSFQNQIVN